LLVIGGIGGDPLLAGEDRRITVGRLQEEGIGTASVILPSISDEGYCAVAPKPPQNLAVELPREGEHIPPDLFGTGDVPFRHSGYPVHDWVSGTTARAAAVVGQNPDQRFRVDDGGGPGESRADESAREWIVPARMEGEDPCSEVAWQKGSGRASRRQM